MTTITTSTIRDIYLEHLTGHPLNPVQQFIFSYCRTGSCDDVDIDALTRYFSSAAQASAIEAYAACLDVLALLLAMKQCKAEQQSVLSVHAAARELMNASFMDSFQPFLAVKELFLFLSGQPLIFSDPVQADCGAAFLDRSGSWTWANAPMQPFHAQLGVVWLLIAKLACIDSFKVAATKLAEWQSQLFDSDGTALLSLFTLEEDAKIEAVLTWNALLFNGCAQVSSDRKMRALAFIQERNLEDLFGKLRMNIAPLAVVAELYFNEKLPSADRTVWVCEEKVYDQQTGLVGKKTGECTVVFSGNGGRSSLGALHFGSLRIVAYGPQPIPIGNCQGFGFEQPILQKYRQNRLHIQYSQEELFLESTAKLCDREVYQQPNERFRLSKNSNSWLETKQTFNESVLKIETTLLSVAKNPLAFVFYVKGSECEIVDCRLIQAQSLDHYLGIIKPVIIKGNGREIKIEAGSGVSKLELIPLAGDNNFWGADFLVAFHLHPDFPKNKFTISLGKCQ